MLKRLKNVKKLRGVKMKSDRFLVWFFSDKCPKDIMKRLNDIELKYVYYVKLLKKHTYMDFDYYYLYLEFENKVDIGYVEIILDLTIQDYDLIDYAVPTSPREDVINYLDYKIQIDSGLKLFEKNNACC